MIVIVSIKFFLKIKKNNNKKMDNLRQQNCFPENMSEKNIISQLAEEQL